MVINRERWSTTTIPPFSCRIRPREGENHRETICHPSPPVAQPIFHRFPIPEPERETDPNLFPSPLFPLKFPIPELPRSSSIPCHPRQRRRKGMKTPCPPPPKKSASPVITYPYRAPIP